MTNYNTMTFDQLSGMTLEELAVLELDATPVTAAIYPVTAFVVSASAQAPDVIAYLVSATAEATADAKLVTITFIDSWS